MTPNKEAWKKDPNSIETDRVQLWSASGIMLSVIPKAEAKRMVANGKAFVITSQAINLYG